VLIYRILLPAEWEQFQAAGEFTGSPFDRASGFVHCSSGAQVAGTARRLFSAEPALVVVALDADVLGATVRWEPSPDGGVFPHVYGALPAAAVVRADRVAGASAIADPS
jgi:uncharacterized protein (DUF952 family)